MIDPGSLTPDTQHPTPPITASIYVHIPFCVRKCLYCDFASYPGKESLFEPYVRALRTEIRRAAERYLDARVPTVYFGGGTPNVLSPEMLAPILDEIRQGFRVDADAEVSTEANPGVRVGEWANGRVVDAFPGSPIPPFPHSLPPLRSAGFNRLSLGVQSLNDDELRQLGRVHTAEEAIEAFHSAREAGFGNISVDLMYGIPGQTRESWHRTLEGALGLGSEHVSLYSLTVEEGTPFYRMQCEGRLEIPGNDIEAEMYEDAIRTLTAAGFVHYEVSNFARPGFECRHNITYWRNEPYFGFGAGATSYIEGTRSTNTTDVEDYIRRTEAGGSPTESEEHLTGREAMGETMFLGLRMLRGLDERRFRERYGASPGEVFGPEIEGLIERGLLERADSFLRLTRRGLFFANDVFAEFV